MIVNSLKLINFRNYSKTEVFFAKGINFIYGDNASGKTSLVEGIYFLSLARSFRTSEDKSLISHHSNFASLIASINLGEVKKDVEVYLSPDGKKIVINRKQIHKISELSGIFNAIYFIPKDVSLLKDSPKNRRLFLDLAISKVSKIYLEHVTNYEKLLRQRNDLFRTNHLNRDLLEVLTNQMIEESREIYGYRSTYLKALNLAFKKIYLEISGSSDDVEVIYSPFINSLSNYVELAKKEFDNSLEMDVKRKQTNKGVQKEDFYILLRHRNVGVYGSQGENRLCVLALKLSPYELIKNYNEKPVVILDDVLSELDINHQKNLIGYLRKLCQVFITSTSKFEIDGATCYLVKNGVITKGDYYGR